MLTVVMVFILAGKAEGQPVITCSNTSCYIDGGGDDGSITINITTGTTGNYRYVIDNGSPIYFPDATGFTGDLSHKFTGLGNGTYQISVIDNSLAPGPYTVPCGPIIITQPTQFTGIDILGWSCAPSPNCNGRLSINILGGSPDYNVQITGNGLNINENISGNSYTLESDLLCAGLTPTISVIDRCAVSQTRSDYIINLDDTDPICTTPPPTKVSINNFNIASILPTPEAIQFYSDNTNTYISNFTVPPPPNTEITSENIIITGSRNYSDLELQVFVSQSTGTWQTNDYLEVEISKDGGATFDPVFIDYCEWTGINETSNPVNPCTVTATALIPTNPWINLGNPLLSNDIIIRFNSLKQDAGTYTVQGINVRGYNTRSLITTTGPSVCNDNIDPNPQITFVDGNIIWRCNTSGNFEFSFLRNWRITDDCGNYTEYPQLISVSSDNNPYPRVQTQTPAFTIDFCKNEDVIIVPPSLQEPPDNCSSLGGITFEWKIYDVDNNELNSWTNITTNTYDFPVASTDPQTFTVGWRITDEAGFSTIIGPEGTPSSQIVTLNPIIAITLERHSTAVDPDGTGPYDICSGNEATFLVRAFGGNGDFNITPLLPAGSNLSWSSGDDTGTLVTSGLTTTPVSTTIRLQYQDTDGCPSTPGTIDFLSGDGIFTVHPNITTNQLIRVP